MFHGPSCLFLATMNLYGTGFAIDYEAALMWMKQAENTRDSRVLEVAQKARNHSACGSSLLLCSYDVWCDRE